MKKKEKNHPRKLYGKSPKLIKNPQVTNSNKSQAKVSVAQKPIYTLDSVRVSPDISEITCSQKFASSQSSLRISHQFK
jgi:hypothetical protein